MAPRPGRLNRRATLLSAVAMAAVTISLVAGSSSMSSPRAEDASLTDRDQRRGITSQSIDMNLALRRVRGTYHFAPTRDVGQQVVSGAAAIKAARAEQTNTGPSRAFLGRLTDPALNLDNKPVYAVILLDTDVLIRGGCRQNCHVLLPVVVFVDALTGEAMLSSTI